MKSVGGGACAHTAKKLILQKVVISVTVYTE